MHMMIRKLSTNQPVRHPARSFALWLVHWLGTGHVMAENLPVGWTGKFLAATSDASCGMSHASSAQRPGCGQRRNRWTIQPQRLLCIPSKFNRTTRQHSRVDSQDNSRESYGRTRRTSRSISNSASAMLSLRCDHQKRAPFYEHTTITIANS